MAADTRIEWADDTTSPWWGCTKVSPACQHCYAKTMAERFNRGSWGPQGERALRVDACLADLAKYARRGLREGRPRRVFLGSMCDVFEQRADLVEPRRALWDGLHALSDGPLAEGIRVMVLTKRAEEMAHYAVGRGWPGVCWAGVTAEDQQRADERIPHLLDVPARVRFVSAEPLLGAVDVTEIRTVESRREYEYDALRGKVYHDSGTDLAGRVSWVIAGGESGRNARPCHPSWLTSLRNQCAAAGVPFHFKRWGEWCPRGGWGTGTECIDTVPRVRLSICGCNSSSDVDYHGVPGAYSRGHECDLSRDAWMQRIGKKAAGRLLDGRTHDDIPEVTR